MRGADNLITLMCRLSRNLGASAFWKLQGLSRPVMGLLYLYLYLLDRYLEKFYWDNIPFFSDEAASLKSPMATFRENLLPSSSGIIKSKET